jgi:hypothetical protein
MALVVVLAVLLVVATAMRLIVTWQDRSKARARGKALALACPTFRVVALGVAGSGKTVFLSSMFQQLNLLSPGGRYRLEARTEDRIFLGGVYAQAANPRQPWPIGTRASETREFLFDCVAVDGKTARKVLSISYLDYAGELLEPGHPGNAAGLADLGARIESAHALLGIIDGLRVRQLLQNEPEGHEYVRGSLHTMIGLMASASCPIHFVVTKWDMVPDRAGNTGAEDSARLATVRDVLMRYLDLTPLFESWARSGRIVRLIPVSAVGNDFATLDAEGEVVKRPNGRVHPTNVEVPLSAVLPDLFRQAASQLDDATRRTIDMHARSHRGLTPAESLAMVARVLSTPAAALLRGTLGLSVGLQYGEEISAVFLDWIGRPFEAKAAAARAARNDAEREAQNAARLRTEVLDEFESAVRRLEVQLPHSKVSG